MEQSALEVASAVLASGQIATGPRVAQLEAALAHRISAAGVVAVSDSTHAQELALRLAGVAPGDEVLSVAYTCLSSSTAIAQVGATPVWVDVDPTTARISVEDCAAALTPRTRAVVAYHIAGYPAALDELRRLCDASGIALIEDANNALGARVDGRPIGSVGDFATFSFYANRQLNAVDGGAVAVRAAATLPRAARLRRYGIEASTFRDADGEISSASAIPEIGMSAALNHVHAALALHQLESLDARLTRNRANAARFAVAFKDLSDVTPVLVPQGSEPAYWAYLVLAKDACGLRERLRRSRIGSSALHLPNDGYTGFRAAARPLAGTRRFATEVVALPCGWWLSDVDVDRIIAAVTARAG